MAGLFCAQLSMFHVEHWRSKKPTWEELPRVLVDLFLDGVDAAPTQS